MEPSVLDDVIGRLLAARGKPGEQVQLSESEVRQLCIVSRTVFMQQPTLLELEAPFMICGDVHGQYLDLLWLFEFGGYPPQVNYLFMGNYVDYGNQSLETMSLLLAYKIKYPKNFFLLRGSHENARTNHIYGFYDECKRRHNVLMWKIFNECFKCLPVAALIDEKILCVHGGLSPDLHNLDQIRNLVRPAYVPDTGLLCDLLWSDPSRGVQGWGMNDRGVSYTFGADKVTKFLQTHDLDLICRSNQVVADGYEFFADRQLVTIFSAPNFRGEYDNASAMMSIDETLVCKFHILKPAEKKFKSEFNIGITNSSCIPSGPSFGSAATARPRNTLNVLDRIAEEDTPTQTNVSKSRSSLNGPDVGNRRTVKPENALSGAKGAVKKAPDSRTDAAKFISSSSKATMMKPGSTPIGANTGTRSAASTRARPSTPRYGSPGSARALGEYVGQSAKAVTRAVSPFNPEREGRRR